MKSEGIEKIQGAIGGRGEVGDVDEMSAKLLTMVLMEEAHVGHSRVGMEILVGRSRRRGCGESEEGRSAFCDQTLLGLLVRSTLGVRWIVVVKKLSPVDAEIESRAAAGWWVSNGGGKGEKEVKSRCEDHDFLGAMGVEMGI